MLNSESPSPFFIKGKENSSFIHIQPSTQSLIVIKNSLVTKRYSVSTAKNGLGELQDSFKTPQGWHSIRAKIGGGEPLQSVFIARRPTGEIYNSTLAKNHPDRDWILTRILWLSGLELGRNRSGNVDTMRRYIYIHGGPDADIGGSPNSKGCIKMKNKDVAEFFELVLVGDKVFIGDRIY